MTNYITTEEAAKRLGFKARTLAIWRNDGVGPEYIKTPTGSVRYAEDALQAWMTSAEASR